MSQPMLSLKTDEKAPKAVANVMPCRIHHNGPIDTVTDYWNPMSAQDGAKTAYFRGRKLQGKSIKLPEQCRGVVVERKKDEIPPAETTDEGEDAPERVGSMQVTAEFDEMVVWGHEELSDASGDPYIRSMEEWLQAADQIHSFEEDEGSNQK